MHFMALGTHLISTFKCQSPFIKRKPAPNRGLVKASQVGPEFFWATTGGVEYQGPAPSDDKGCHCQSGSG